MNEDTDSPALVPAPQAVEALPGHFTLGAETAILAPENLVDEARRLQQILRASTGFDLPIARLDLRSAPAASRAADSEDAEACGDVSLALDASLDKEAYTLNVEPHHVEIVGGSPAGVGHGVSTLLRMFPAQAFRASPISEGPWTVPCVSVNDEPTFQWRGLMIDVARHFMPKRELFRVIDLMALLQFNVMHLHLTDDQGWRVQIEGYPRLEEVASWRTESQIGPAWTTEHDGRPHGGIYSQDDLRELVAYAQARNISLMPEVDLPGHMEAAIAAYPNFGTSRTPTAVRTKWGISTNVLNLDPDTIDFVREVIDQVADIFPFEYFSIGGDECPTEGWALDPQTQERKTELGIDTDRGVQAWYTKMVAGMLRERGRRIVAWDEVLEGELDDDVVILSWRGMRGAEIGMARGLDVIACPTYHSYFDYRQSESPDEPVPVGVPVTLEQVYAFNPIPAGEPLKPWRGRVIGGQANLWSEFMNTSRSLDFAAFPRAAALAEVLWSGPGRDFEDFMRRLPALLERLDVLGVEYRPLDGPLPWQKRPGVPGSEGDMIAHKMWITRETEKLKIDPS